MSTRWLIAAWVMACNSNMTVPDAATPLDSGSFDACAGCTATGAALLACLSLDSGVYGNADTICIGSGCPGPNYGGCINGLTVTATPIAADAGLDAAMASDASVEGAATIVMNDIHYAMELTTGRYSVCCSQPTFYPPPGPGCSSETCAVVNLDAGQRIQIDVRLKQAAGGCACVATAK